MAVSSSVIGSASRISENESVSNSKMFRPACKRFGNVLLQQKLLRPGRQQLSVARAVRIYGHLEVPEKARCILHFVNKHSKRMTLDGSAPAPFEPARPCGKIEGTNAKSGMGAEKSKSCSSAARRLGTITDSAFAERFRRPSISARNYTFTIYDTIAYFAPFHWIHMNPNQPHSGYKQPSPVPDTEPAGMHVYSSTGIPHARRYSNVPS
jgi:hypothetical protein